jgi:4-oxalocrotonate tautomerase
MTRHSTEVLAMPHVQITWVEGRTVEQKWKVVERFTKVLEEEAGAKPEKTQITIVDVPLINFATGGVLVADSKARP